MSHPDAEPPLTMAVFHARLSDHLKRLAQAADVLDDISKPPKHVAPSAATIKTFQNIDYLQQALNDLAVLTHELSHAVATGMIASEDAQKIAAKLSLEEVRRSLTSGEKSQSTPTPPRSAGELDLF